MEKSRWDHLEIPKPENKTQVENGGKQTKAIKPPPANTQRSGQQSSQGKPKQQQQSPKINLNPSLSSIPRINNETKVPRYNTNNTRRNQIRPRDIVTIVVCLPIAAALACFTVEAIKFFTSPAGVPVSVIITFVLFLCFRKKMFTS